MNEYDEAVAHRGLTLRWIEFVNRRRDGMIYALDGGLWFHLHTWRGERMAHMVSADRDALLRAGNALGLNPTWLQYQQLRDPRTGERVDAWHWDLRGVHLSRAATAAARHRDTESKAV